MSDVCSFFVYGTLKQGEVRARLWPVAPIRIVEASIQAEMYDLGPYPAIIPGSDRIRGERWEFLPRQVALTQAALDAIEGYRERDDDLYVRRAVDCTDIEGMCCLAFVYFLSRTELLQYAERILPDAAGECRWMRRGDSGSRV